LSFVLCAIPRFIILKVNVKVKKVVLSISPTLLNLGSPNIVCEYILGWQNVAYYL